MHNGRSMANVTADQLKETGLALPQYIRLWDKTGARPAAGAGEQADTKKEAVIKEVRDRILKSRAGALAGNGAFQSSSRQAERRALERRAAYLSKQIEEATKRLKGALGYKKGGLVKKSAAKNIDGIATKGKTRAKHK